MARLASAVTLGWPQPHAWSLACSFAVNEPCKRPRCCTRLHVGLQGTEAAGEGGGWGDAGGAARADDGVRPHPAAALPTPTPQTQCHRQWRRPDQVTLFCLCCPCIAWTWVQPLLLKCTVKAQGTQTAGELWPNETAGTGSRVILGDDRLAAVVDGLDCRMHVTCNLCCKQVLGHAQDAAPVLASPASEHPAAGLPRECCHAPG